MYTPRDTNTIHDERIFLHSLSPRAHRSNLYSFSSSAFFNLTIGFQQFAWLSVSGLPLSISIDMNYTLGLSLSSSRIYNLDLPLWFFPSTVLSKISPSNTLCLNVRPVYFTLFSLYFSTTIISPKPYLKRLPDVILSVYFIFWRTKFRMILLFYFLLLQ